MEGVPFFCCEGGHARSAYLMLASFGLYTLQQLTDELPLLWLAVVAHVTLNCAAVGSTVCAITQLVGWCSVSCS